MSNDEAKGCFRCKRVLPFSAFPKASAQQQMKHGLSTYCRDCWRVMDKERRAAKRDVVTAYKMAAGCMDCGYREHPEALQFDHRPGEVKEFTIGVSMSKSLERIWAEIAKCDVVCANCHAVRTATRRLAAELEGLVNV